MTTLDDDVLKTEQNIKEIAKERTIWVENNIVKISFMTTEDAKNFADNLKKFVEK